MELVRTARKCVLLAVVRSTLLVSSAEVIGEAGFQLGLRLQPRSQGRL